MAAGRRKWSWHPVWLSSLFYHHPFLPSFPIYPSFSILDMPFLYLWHFRSTSHPSALLPFSFPSSLSYTFSVSVNPTSSFYHPLPVSFLSQSFVFPTSTVPISHFFFLPAPSHLFPPFHHQQHYHLHRYQNDHHHLASPPLPTFTNIKHFTPFHASYVLPQTWHYMKFQKLYICLYEENNWTSKYS